MFNRALNFMVWPKRAHKESTLKRNKLIVKWNKSIMKWNKLIMKWNNYFMIWNKRIRNWNNLIMKWNKLIINNWKCWIALSGAGDGRFRTVPTLNSFHALFLREHNRLATELAALRPDWNDEELFQRARRIVIAEWQNIVYSEYLPIVLGSTAMRDLDLDLDKSEYDPNVDASIRNSFATASYRYSHLQYTIAGTPMF